MMSHPQQFYIDFVLFKKLTIFVSEGGVGVLHMGHLGDVEGDGPLHVVDLDVEVLDEGEDLVLRGGEAADVHVLEQTLVKFELVSELEGLVLNKGVDDRFFLFRVLTEIVIPTVHDLAHIQTGSFKFLHFIIRL